MEGRDNPTLVSMNKQNKGLKAVLQKSSMKVKPNIYQTAKKIDKRATLDIPPRERASYSSEEDSDDEADSSEDDDETEEKSGHTKVFLLSPKEAKSLR